MKTDERKHQFLRSLEQLTRATGIRIGGCGCCGSPYLDTMEPAELDARAGYAITERGGDDAVTWISPENKYDWEEYRGAIVRRGGQDDYGMAWDYEESTAQYYMIYTNGGPFDGTLDAFTIEVPQTPENDADVQTIVDALRRMAARSTNDR